MTLFFFSFFFSLSYLLFYYYYYYFLFNRFPFSSDRKRMSSVVAPRDGSSPYRVYTKGASEIVLGLCKYIATPSGTAIEMTSGQNEYISNNITRMASDGKYM